MRACSLPKFVFFNRDARSKSIPIRGLSRAPDRTCDLRNSVQKKLAVGARWRIPRDSKGSVGNVRVFRLPHTGDGCIVEKKTGEGETEGGVRGGESKREAMTIGETRAMHHSLCSKRHGKKTGSTHVRRAS